MTERLIAMLNGPDAWLVWFLLWMGALSLLIGILDMLRDVVVGLQKQIREWLRD